MIDLDPQRKRLCGVGLGLRWEFLDDVLEASPGEIDVAFFEVSPENYMRRGGWYPAALERVRETHPLVTHGLTLSLGAVEEPEPGYLDALKLETERLKTPWHSDHLCFSTSGGRVLHELLPLQFSKENVTRVADRVRRIEDRLGLPMAIENITWYAHPGQKELREADFIAEILERADCGLLLDVNNVWVNAQNHGFDPREFIAALPLDRVVQMHVAGHTLSSSGLIVDTHGAPVIDPVVELLEWTLERTGPMPVLLERDNDIPELVELLAEVRKLSEVYRRATSSHQATLARTA